MEIRKYTEKEKEVLKEVMEKLRESGLEPMDVVSATHLFDIYQAISDMHNFVDLDIRTANIAMVSTALSHKEGSFHKETLERVLQNIKIIVDF